LITQKYAENLTACRMCFRWMD